MPTRWSHAPLPCLCDTCLELIDEGDRVAITPSGNQSNELLLICAPCAEDRWPEDDDLDWSGWPTD